jgi:alkanesulfonate monooxygenase SsuD/methylene tetrahydromethanopterin reductase-like flavin-dependent oxidoreductase (luciferase family)
VALDSDLRPGPSADLGPDARSIWGLVEPRLGLALGGAHDAKTLARDRAWVLEAERLELHSVWLPEMHFAPGACPTPLIELAGHAARTQRIRLGTTSLLLPLHPAEILAAQVAALDRISGGRALIGLGRGFRRPMLEAFGVDPASKRDRFDESLDRMLAIWQEAHDRNGPLAPHQRPHPPLAVAAFGPKGLAQAARRGLPYLASPVETLDQIEQNQARHRALLPDPDRRSLSLLMRTVFICNDAPTLETARRVLTDEMTQGRLRGPASLRLALEAPLEARAIVGTPQAVRERLLRDCRRLDVDLLIVRPRIPHLPTGTVERSFEILAREIWPDLQVERAARRSTGAGDAR